MKRLASLILLLTLLATFIPGCTRSATNPLSVELSFKELPVLNKPVQIWAVFELRAEQSNPRAGNMTAQIILPDGFERVSGNLTWHGDLVRGVPQTIIATVKSVKTGLWMIEARGEYYQDGMFENRAGWGNTVFATITEDGASVSDSPPVGNPTSTAASVTPATPPPAPAHSAHFDWQDQPDNSTGPTDNQTFSWAVPVEPKVKRLKQSAVAYPITITDNITSGDLTGLPIPSVKSGNLKMSSASSFWDPLTVTGYWGCYVTQPGTINTDTPAPMVWGAVWVRNATTTAVLGSGVTDGNGEFAITVENPLGQGIYIQVAPITDAGEVKSQLLENYVRQPKYWWKPYSGMGSIDIGNFEITDTTAIAAWRIYETMANDYYGRGAYYFVTASDKGPHMDMPVVTALYPASGGGGLSWYDPLLKQLMITDSFNSVSTKGLTTVQHEYGHRVYAALGGSVFPSIYNHYFGVDIGNSWGALSEGWADFFPLWVQNSPYYDDGFNTTNFDTPPSDWQQGDRVEGRVASAFWDLYNSSNNGGYDQYSCGGIPIWNALSWSFYENPLSTFANFWDNFNDGLSAHDVLWSARALYKNTIVYPEWILVGDANKDNVVNMSDFGILAATYGKSTGQTGYDSRADFNGDGVIKLSDFGLLAKNYGTTAPG